MSHALLAGHGASVGIAPSLPQAAELNGGGRACAPPSVQDHAVSKAPHPLRTEIRTSISLMLRSGLAGCVWCRAGPGLHQQAPRAHTLHCKHPCASRRCSGAIPCEIANSPLRLFVNSQQCISIQQASQAGAPPEQSSQVNPQIPSIRLQPTVFHPLRNRRIASHALALH